jgi:histidine triad (HIT) family protein
VTADDCTFCGIVADPARAATCYEDDAAIAILDLRQPGWPDAVHALVIPRPHVEVLDELDDETASGLMRAVVQVARLIRAAVSPEGYNLW